LKKFATLLLSLLSLLCIAGAQEKTTISEAGLGWAKNSVNVVIFRKNSLTSLGDTQYIAYYDNDANVIIGKRVITDKKWKLVKTKFKGNASDAHNSISIMVDGGGYLHMAWDHHNNPLRYCKSVAPGSLEMSDKMSMTGLAEQNLSYPEFYRMPNGNLLFFYRNGQSGNGNLVINQYDIKTQQWKQLQSNLIDGEGKRNAYWEACLDAKGTIHISWVWRESPDVASNHDMGYARSDDGGVSWKKSTGEKYTLPITEVTAEYAAHIPQRSELINQTSMYALEDGTPVIASYWKTGNDTAPLYHVLWLQKGKWMQSDLKTRKTPFSLSGAGTKRIPISRPQVIAWKQKNKTALAIIFRDEERGNKVSIAITDNLQNANWRVKDLSQEPAGSWEPSYDTELWKNKRILHLFLQFADQQDAEGKTNTPPQSVKVLEWRPRS
jgi:hypothetical protein